MKMVNMIQTYVGQTFVELEPFSLWVIADKRSDWVNMKIATSTSSSQLRV